jgi:hypothetical protein
MPNTTGCAAPAVRQDQIDQATVVALDRLALPDQLAGAMGMAGH